MIANGTDLQDNSADDRIHSECSCGCGDECEECPSLMIDGDNGRAMILCDCEDGPFCICPTRSMLRFESMDEFYLQRGGRLSAKLSFGSFNWDDSVPVETASASDAVLDRLMLVALVRDTGDWYASGKDGVYFLGRICAGVPESDVREMFRENDDIDRNGPGQPLSWFRDRIDAFNSWWPRPMKIPDRIWDSA